MDLIRWIQGYSRMTGGIELSPSYRHHWIPLFILISNTVCFAQAGIDDMGLHSGIDCHTSEVIMTDDIMSSRLRLEAVPFFSHIPEELKGHVSGEAFMEVDAGLAIEGGIYHLELYVRINSPKATELYGGYGRGSMCRIKFLKGESAIVRNISTANGIYLEEPGYTVYKLTFPLGRRQLRQISRYGVDKVTMFWTLVAEQYDIYNVDCLREQMDCMKKLLK